MVRIIKKDRVAYFSMAGVPLKWENKSIVKLDPSDPYYNILMSYEKLKDNISETEDAIQIGDVVFDKQNESFTDVDGESVEDRIGEAEEDAVTFMLESEEVEGDENKIIMKEDDDESVISIVEADEADAENTDGIDVKVEDKNASDEDSEEIELIVSKLEDISSNILKLEDADLEQDPDLQKVYLEELGKKHLLEERLAELNYSSGDKKETVVSKILESHTYLDLRKKPEVVRMVESHKMGAKVNKYILEASRARLLESIKKTGKLKESGVTVDYHPQDGNFIFSGNLAQYTDEQILLVPEEDFFDVFDTIIKGIDLLTPETILKEEEEELEQEFEVTPVKIDKVAESLEKLKEDLGTTELQDGEYYRTKCELYLDQDGKISENVSVGCSLYCPSNYVLQYSKEHNCMVSEEGVTFTISEEYLEPCGEIVKPSDLVENETYVAVDDHGDSAQVTYEGEDVGSGLLEFKTKLKESFYINKKLVHQYIRFK